MEELQAYLPEAIIRSNLDENAMRHRMICEQELSHLRELALEIAEGEALTSEFLATLPDHQITKDDLQKPTDESSGTAVTAHMRATTVWRNLCLCNEILKQFSPEPSIPEDFLPDTEELPASAVDRIVYRRNSYADDAYLQFAAHISSPKASYADTFDAVCESVYAKRCEYGILPLEDTKEGELSSFRRLIDRYELHIVATCNVRTAEVGHVTRFALLGATPIVLSHTELGERFFECAVSDGISIGELLYAAECCELSLAHIRTDIHHPDRSPTTRTVFRAENAKLPTFLLYLNMVAPGYRFIGLYPHISNS